MKIETRYDIGDKMFWLRDWQGIVGINYDPIKSINVGGKAFKKYAIDNTTRAEKDLFVKFDDAKAEAKRLQREQNEKALEIIEEYRSPII